MDNRGFWRKLFDMRFESFVTRELVRYMYICVMLFLAVFSLSAFVAAWQQASEREESLFLIGGLVVIILIDGIVLLMSRFVLESMVVLFVVAENTAATSHGVSALSRVVPDEENGESDGNGTGEKGPEEKQKTAEEREREARISQLKAMIEELEA